LKPVEELEKDGYSVEKLIELELAECPSRAGTVWKAYDDLGDLFLKPVLYKVYGDDLQPPGDWICTMNACG
jgi:hypothetical protein